MPFDGTEPGLFDHHPLAKLGAVERLLVTERHWCKGKLRDSDGRHCLVGAMQAVEARQILEPIILRAAREVGGKCYWRIEFFNDDPRTTHADVLRVLRRARENIVAGMIESDRRRPWHRRLRQVLRALCAGSRPGSQLEIAAAPYSIGGAASSLFAEPAIASLEPHRDHRPSPVRATCEMS